MKKYLSGWIVFFSCDDVEEKDEGDESIGEDDRYWYR